MGYDEYLFIFLFFGLPTIIYAVLALLPYRWPTAVCFVAVAAALLWLVMNLSRDDYIGLIVLFFGAFALVAAGVLQVVRKFTGVAGWGYVKIVLLGFAGASLFLAAVIE